MTDHPTNSSDTDPTLIQTPLVTTFLQVPTAFPTESYRGNTRYGTQNGRPRDRLWPEHQRSRTTKLRNGAYSKSQNDPTIERVRDSAQGNDAERWSVMSSGTDTDQYLPPTNERYFAFSIEELLTVSTADEEVD